MVQGEEVLRMKKTGGNIKSKNIKSNSRSDGDKKNRGSAHSAGESEITAKAITEAAVDLKVPVDFVEARKNIATLVWMSSNQIVAELISQAKSGELAPTKYLFELVGLYPATAETTSKPENSLAYALLKRMGLPTEPAPAEEDAKPAPLSRAAEPVAGADGGAEEKRKVNLIESATQAGVKFSNACRQEEIKDAVK